MAIISGKPPVPINLVMVKVGSGQLETGYDFNRKGMVYTAEYVNRMYQMVWRNLDSKRYLLNPFCITDDRSDLYGEIIPLKPKPNLQGWWHKIALFSSLAPFGLTLYMDLDQVILGDLTQILDACVAQPKDTISCYADFKGCFGSAMMVYHPERHLHLWNRFWNERPPMDRADYGDQDWLHEVLTPESVFYFNRRFPEAARSYKLEVMKNPLSPETKIINFHGRPKPHELVATHDWIRKAWQ